MLLELSVGLSVGLLLFRFHLHRKWGQHDVNNEIDITGKIVLITGGNSGLGKQTAKELGARGAVVIIASRNLTKSKAVAEELPYTIIPMQLDLSSLTSIRNFVEEFTKNYPKLDILILNAGVATPGLKTATGLDLNFQTNHIGHFQLTKLLLTNLTKGTLSPKRIIIVASTLAKKGRINFSDLTTGDTYANSKLANIMFNKELSRRLQDTDINTYALCPGWVKTDLFRHHGWIKHIMAFPFALLFMRSSAQGVQTILHCALSKSVANESGLLYRNVGIWDMEIDDSQIVKLWEISE